MYHKVPGVRAGAYVGALPGLPQVALGAERTSFAHSCCGNTVWYRNWRFIGGWAENGHPLGHPLGGQGVEWRAYARAALSNARVRLRADVFTRERGPENLFAPERMGSSRGGQAELQVRVHQAGDIVVGGSIEDGDDWRSTSFATGVRLWF
jgi:hypothetical protein